jgi:hypothetical protein
MDDLALAAEVLLLLDLIQCGKPDFSIAHLNAIAACWLFYSMKLFNQVLPLAQIPRFNLPNRMLFDVWSLELFLKFNV